MPLQIYRVEKGSEGRIVTFISIVPICIWDCVNQIFEFLKRK